MKRILSLLVTGRSAVAEKTRDVSYRLAIVPGVERLIMTVHEIELSL